MKYDVDPQQVTQCVNCPDTTPTGITNARMFVDLKTLKDQNGAPVPVAAPEALAIDDAGSLVVAGAANVPVIRNDGQVIGVIAVGAPTTSLAYGGADRRSLCSGWVYDDSQAGWPRMPIRSPLTVTSVGVVAVTAVDPASGAYSLVVFLLAKTLWLVSSVFKKSLWPAVLITSSTNRSASATRSAGRKVLSGRATSTVPL